MKGTTVSHCANWKSLSNTTPEMAQLQDSSQRAWDKAVCNQSFKLLFDTQTESYHQARLLAASASHSGDWLSAMPISACGLRLTDEAVCVAVGLRLGTELGQVHKCICGASVDTRGTHAFSCGRNPGRAQRHHYVNDLIWRSLSRAGIPWYSTTRVDQVRREETGWVDINPMARRTQRHLGRHSHQHSRYVIRGNDVSLRRSSRRSRSTAQGKQICRDNSNSPVLSVSIRNNGPHQ